MKYEIVMGLEVHAELSTASKLFCSCSARYGKGANENVCPACAGMPGMLPVANKRAIELGMIAGVVTNSEITRRITFDKKNYFYPDLSTGYQITQWFAPICRNGYIEIETSKGKKRINLKQIHIEEDAGKLVHDPRTDTSLVDYNRASVPLAEIVSKPDFRSAEEVVAYLEKLRSLLSFAGVSDCKMHEGSMRCDVNISVREEGSQVLGTRTEMKNMNSIKAIVRAIEYEAQRHIDALETGCEELVQETRRWDDNKGCSFSMRNKENATDYRYFPNPDIMPIVITDEWLDEVKKTVPKSQSERYDLMVNEYGISEYDAGILTSSKAVADLFDKVAFYYPAPAEISGWIIGDLTGIAKKENINVEDVKINAEQFAALIKAVADKKISRNNAKKLLQKLLSEDVNVEEYIAGNDLSVVDDEGALRGIIAEIIAKNPKAAAEFAGGNAKTLGFFVGQVMRATKGQADPAAVNRLLNEVLKGN